MTETYLVSPSQFRVHKTCPEQHYYTYGLQLRPRKRDTKFDVGSYFHELAHFYYQLLKSGYKIGDPHTISAMDTKLRNDLKEVKPSFQKTLLQVHIMFMRYLKRRTSVIDSNIEILEVEKELQLLVPGTTVGIHGILDLLYRKRGKLVIRDHKTGENKSAHSNESISFDDQLLTYAVMVWKIFNEIPIIEINWVNSKVDYKTEPTNDQLFGHYTKTLTKDYLEGYWTYLQEYVYHMQTVPRIRSMTTFKCKQCPYIDPCLFALRGLDNRNLIEANFEKVPRNYDYQRFTEIAKANKDSRPDSSSQTNELDFGELRINFS
jgi:hypothetical protein